MGCHARRPRLERPHRPARSDHRECPERVSRFVVMDSGVFTGHERMGEAWLRFGDFVARVPKLPVKRLIRIRRKSPPPPEILGASQAPFPNAKSKAGARAFPQLIPSPPRRPVLRPVRRSPGRSKNARPVLLLWADSDPMLPLETLGRQA
jgi:haloalkane dehalogenase